MWGLLCSKCLCSNEIARTLMCGSLYVQIIPVLIVTTDDSQLAMVRVFVQTDEYTAYVEDA